jgi:hypothetical protein
MPGGCGKYRARIVNETGAADHPVGFVFDPLRTFKQFPDQENISYSSINHGNF